MNLAELVASLQPFMNAQGETFIQVIMSDDKTVEQMALDDPLARCVVRNLLCKYLRRGHPTEKETRIALDVIIGEAFQRSRKDADLSIARRLQQEPLALAVLATSKTGDMLKTPADLLVLLRRTAEREGISTDHVKWPKSEDSLGKQLTRLIPLLAAAGVTVKRHDERPRKWSITSLPEAARDRSDIEVTDASPTPTVTCEADDTCQWADEVNQEITNEMLNHLTKEQLQ